MLRILGLLFLALIVGAAIVTGLAYRQNQRAREYVVAAIPAIYQEWDFAELKKRAASKLLNETQFSVAGPQMFRMMGASLGRLEKADAPEGEAGFGWGEGAPARGVYGNYEVHAKFEKGEAQLQLFVIKEGGSWRIAGFHVDSPALLDALREQRSTQ